MRQITFRGKTKDGEWVYGYYFDGYILQYIDLVTTWESSSPYDMNVICRAYEVLPETVGQWTGLKDIKGVNIYDGDIIIATGENSLSGRKPKDVRHIPLNKRMKVFYHEGAFKFKANSRSLNNHLTGAAIRFHGIVVVGNIHDKK